MALKGKEIDSRSEGGRFESCMQFKVDRLGFVLKMQKFKELGIIIAFQKAVYIFIASLYRISPSTDHGHKGTLISFFDVQTLSTA